MTENKNLNLPQPKTTPAVLGLGGKYRSGKDEVADHLVRAHGWRKVGMSDALHEFLLRQNPDVAIRSVPEPYVSTYREITETLGYVEAKNLIEFRTLMQRTGTEAGREVLHNNIWADAARDRIVKHRSEGYNVVLTGVRFENELHMVERLGGYTGWIHRPSEEIPLDVTVTQVVSAIDSALAHVSENTLSEADFEFTIPNMGTLSDLYTRTDELAAVTNSPRGGAAHRPWPTYDH